MNATDHYRLGEEWLTEAQVAASAEVGSYYAALAHAHFAAAQAAATGCAGTDVKAWQDVTSPPLPAPAPVGGAR